MVTQTFQAQLERLDHWCIKYWTCNQVVEDEYTCGVNVNVWANISGTAGETGSLVYTVLGLAINMPKIHM